MKNPDKTNHDAEYYKQIFLKYGSVVYGFAADYTGSKADADLILLKSFSDLKHNISKFQQARCKTVWFVKYAMQNCVEYAGNNNNITKDKNLIYIVSKEWLIKMKQSKAS